MTNENLVMQYKTTNSEKLLEELVKQNEGFIVNQASKIHRQFYNQEFDDIKQSLTEGFVRAISTYNPNKKCLFLTWAWKIMFKSWQNTLENKYRNYESRMIIRYLSEHPSATLVELTKFSKKKFSRPMGERKIRALYCEFLGDIPLPQIQVQTGISYLLEFPEEIQKICQLILDGYTIKEIALAMNESPIILKKKLQTNPHILELLGKQKKIKV